MSPDNRRHRGPGPRDHYLFARDQLPVLSEAARDYCWLLDRNYTAKSALKLVGDHFKLQERQRSALDRSCQPISLVERIKAGEVTDYRKIRELPIVIDGFNLLIILEAALSQAPVFKGRDSLIRDISGLHGSYRKISETPQAISLAADFFKSIKPSSVLWVFDKPVSNSARLAQLVREKGLENNMKWETHLANQTDNHVAESDAIVISSDSQILARCKKWFNLTSYLLSHQISNKWLINLWQQH